MRMTAWALALMLAQAVCAQENLVANPGFELVGDDGALLSWTPTSRYVEGQAGPVSDVVHSGLRSAMVRADRYQPPADAAGTGGIGLQSAWFDAPPPNTTLEVAGWIRAQNVHSPGSYYMLRYTIYFFAADGATRISHHDIACTEGSFDWRRVSAHLIVPAGAARLKLACQLTACTGTAWFDDLSVKIAYPAPTVSGVLDALRPLDGPAVVPAPERATYGDPLPLAAVAAAVTCEPDDRLQRAVQQVMAQAGVTLDDTAAARLIMGGPELASELALVLGELSMTDLGDQGYCLQVAPAGETLIIRVAANTDQGRYYALQTLRQLIIPGAVAPQVWQASIVDRPTLSRRGMAMGAQWFGQQAEALDRLAELKCNFVWNQGSFLGGKFGGNLRDRSPWREPLTEAERRAMSDYLALCRERFVQPAVSISPRGAPPTTYCSEGDINLVVDKLATLYDLGFHHLGLNFDDLRNIGQDRLTEAADRAAFGEDIGAAHLHFCHEVYSRLQARCPDLVFWVLPMHYAGFLNLDEAGRQYLRTLAQLPAQVGMVVCANDPDNLRLFTELTGRRPLVWDNWFAPWERGGAPAFVPPLDRAPTMSDDNTSGYIFLPMVPAYEDAGTTSWLTAADYLWSPQRYLAAAAFHRAVHAALGPQEGTAVFRELGQLLADLDANPPDADSAPAAIARLRALLPRLQQALPPRTFVCVQRHITQRLRALEKLRGQ